MIKTLHNSLMEEEYCMTRNTNLDFQAISLELSSSIIKMNPGLIADVSSGKIERIVLEKEIIKLIDNKRYKVQRDIMIKEIMNYMFGYGILQYYIENENITDIDGTRYNYFMIKENGIKKKIDIKFSTEEEFDKFCRLIIIRNGGIINENDSHARVSDENYRLRINVAINPRNITGPSLTIRKHRRTAYSLEELSDKDMFDKKVEKILVNIANSNSRIIFSGKGAAGKTTLLRAFIKKINESERILVCESDAEIYPESKNFISQRIKKDCYGGRKLELKDLLKDGLTMSLDGYCVGELVGEETWDFLKAGYTDHKIIGTLHAISAEDSLYRLLMLIENSIVGLSENTVKKVIANSLDIIVYLKNFEVQEIIKVNRYSNEKRVFEIDYLYKKKN